MKKIAVLVTTTLRTRVVVEVPDTFDENAEGDLWYSTDEEGNNILPDKVADVAAEQMKDIIDAGIYENIEEAVLDTEMPYGEGLGEQEGKIIEVVERDNHSDGTYLEKFLKTPVPFGSKGDKEIVRVLVDNSHLAKKIVCHILDKSDNSSFADYTDLFYEEREAIYKDICS